MNKVPLLHNPIEHLLQRLPALSSTRLCAKSSNSRYLIALSGLPGSGKSTLAARLAHEVNVRQSGAMMTLSMDGFHLTKAQLRQMPDPQAALARRGAPWTFDVHALFQRLQLLRDNADQETSWPDFQHGIGDPVQDAFVVAPSTRLILIEGLYLLRRVDGWESVSAKFDERWFLDTAFDVAMERLINRHMASWQITRKQAAERISSNDRLNAQIVAQDAQNANWRVLGG
jgi:pantothenate kinase